MKLTSMKNHTLLLFLFSLSHIALASITKHLCLHDQKTVLLQLQKDILSLNSSSVTFDERSSFKVATWDSKTDCCTWDGITCDNNLGHVIGLNLSYSRISGNIDAIFNLRRLQFLSLARNSFQLTPIPSGIEKLSNLTHLNLSFSCFSDQIPAGISRLVRLTSLDLSTITFCELPPTFDDPNSNNIFEFEELHRLRLEKPNLESFFMNLKALTELNLDSVDLSAQGSNWAQALSGLSNLKFLSLYQCRLSGPIHSSFQNLRSLNYLNIESNNLSSEAPRFLASFKDLQVLNIAATQIYGRIPGNVFLLPKLETIDLSKNKLLTGDLPEFPSHSSLQMVSLYETNFQGKLPDSIGNLKSLTNLLLYTCNFSGLIPPSIANLTSVVEIEISYNKFNGSIPPFRNIGVPNLQDLRLSFNLLTGTIDPLLFTLPSLKILYLNDNRLSGGLEEFSPSSSVLETLYLDSNNLSGKIPRSISAIPSLSVVSLASNKFSGTIKMEAFQNLNNLSSLDLSFNGLTFSADKPDLVFPSLDELNLSKCNITEFPAFLKAQEQLRTLNLSNNQIHGFVPEWLKWTSSLNELDLSENKVDFPLQSNQGDNKENLAFSTLGKLVMRSCNVSRFPEFLNALDSVWYLDLSGNKMEGLVPNWIWNDALQYVNISHNNLDFVEEFHPNVPMNLLETLDIRGNIIKGSLPNGICNLTSLSILDASHNHLNGSIPECLGKMGSLTVLNFQGNEYKKIPSQFGLEGNLSSLNINGNLLQGQLPRSLRNCKKLEVLDLGNNMIRDSFPFWLEELPELKVVILRNNSFYGQIQPPRRKNFSLPNLGIIDLSSNHFTGNLPREFLLSMEEMLMSNKSKSRDIKAIGSYEYYQDSVTIMSKGTEMTLVRILTIFVSLDLSNNRFSGKIPDQIGELRSLIVLNLSRNGFDLNIPSTLRNLAELESLDLSWNKLSGEIPQTLAGLTFMSSFNLSYNNLTGIIPRGNQLDTFSNDSYLGNAGLCGPPLSRPCGYKKSVDENAEHESSFEWMFALPGYGCGVIIGFVNAYVFLPGFRYERGRLQLWRWSGR